MFVITGIIVVVVVVVIMVVGGWMSVGVGGLIGAERWGVGG